ncbi:Benzoate--CoA ligase [Paraconexibacter sp. AEG42_29]|uniref:Benzoate--CoA ligase n=1 Tax=Paraconexibacter sp. AEG42_29 TaxID=2997339 RepID=A0AAU7B0I8_9ACTN
MRVIQTDRWNASSIVDRHEERSTKTAYIDGDTTLTYGELRQQVNRAGHLLRGLGVRREDRVLLVLDDSIAFPVMFFGAMRIGAVPVPVSGLDKSENFRHYHSDTYAEVVVADAASLPRLQDALAGEPVRYVFAGEPGHTPPGVLNLAEGLAGQSDELEAWPTHRDDMAFWLYSSGSTGRPKGAVHLHHDIAVTCETYAANVLGLREDDVTFSTTKLFHAYGLGNGLSFPLWFGATAVLMNGPTKPEAILRTLHRHRPTIFFSVPAVYRMIAREPEAPAAFASVRRCVSASEPLPPQTFRTFKDRFGVEIVDGIGSTELLHIYCSNRPGEIVPGTTGKGVPGYELRLVDEFGSVLQGAATGALEVRGDSCAAYYWHQHEKTKSSMRGDWFATGDRYERREDGNFVYIGRLDQMFKVGGLWVSPVDMEHALLEHDRVRGVGVTATTINNASRIAAFVECDGDGDEELAAELRALCKERLRRYEYPHVVEFVDALPRTLTGKVQRFKLRERAALLGAQPPYDGAREPAPAGGPLKPDECCGHDEARRSTDGPRAAC